MKWILKNERVCETDTCEIREKEVGAFVLGDTDAARLLPKRTRDSHKGTYGKAGIVAGSKQYTGAAYLATAACLRSGVGYTTLFAPSYVVEKGIWRLPEALLCSLNEGDKVAFNEKNLEKLLSLDALSYGMGLGVDREVAFGVKFLLDNYKGTLILDADALNSLSTYAVDWLDAMFTQKKCNVILTPHSKEFSRLTGKSVEEIINAPVEIAKAYAKRWQVTILLKNAFSVITDGDKVYINETGNSGQAKAGSGDVLSGLLTGLCASGVKAFDGAVLAPYIVGVATEIATRDISEYSVTASDISSHIGLVFLRLTENTDK